MRAAAIQLNSTSDFDRNLAAADRLVREAAAAGAGFVALPEKWSVLGDSENLRAGAQALDGPAIEAARGWARELGVHVLAGSIAEQVDDQERLSNTSVLVAAGGEIAGVYRKIHMFDVEVGGVRYHESENELAGDEIAVASVGELEVGLSVCYDLRFPELYRILAVRGARMLTVPSAFTATTGRDHWEVLLRARAIENQAFVIAPNQVGEAPPNYDSWGHSMIVDPWGRVVAEAPDGEGFVVADLDFTEQERIRESLPSLANRQPHAYVWPSADPAAPGGEAEEAGGTLVMS